MRLQHCKLCLWAQVFASLFHCILIQGQFKATVEPQPPTHMQLVRTCLLLAACSQAKAGGLSYNASITPCTSQFKQGSA